MAKLKEEAESTMKLTCSGCKKSLHKSKYSKTQWSKNSTVTPSKCKSCISQRSSGCPKNPPDGRQEQPTLIPLERTEAYRVRQNNIITPKDRLIKYCELGCMMDLGKINHVILLPEKLQVMDDNGVALSVSYTSTPYEYWGLPRESVRNGSKNFNKKVIKRCSYFFELDLEWMVDHAELVKPYFDDVAIEGKRNNNGMNFEGVSWTEQIELLRDEIACDGSDGDDLADELGAMTMNG